MAKVSDKDVKGVTSEGLSRVESSGRSDKLVRDYEPALYSSSKAVLTPTDKKRRTIQERERKAVALARAHILTCGDFLLAEDLANHLDIQVELLRPALREWEEDLRIFSIDHDDLRFFPVYAFPSQGGVRPIPGLGEVLSILLSMKDGWGMSFWFISPNGFLGGKRPQDLLSTEPAHVISAAQDEAGGVTHG